MEAGVVVFGVCLDAAIWARFGSKHTDFGLLPDLPSWGVVGAGRRNAARKCTEPVAAQGSHATPSAVAVGRAAEHDGGGQHHTLPPAPGAARAWSP